MNTGNIEACIELAQVRAGHGDATPAEALAELDALKLRAAAPPKIDGVPTVPGWYWAKWPEHENVRPIRVRMYSHGLLAQPFDSECLFKLDTFTDYHGPLTPPKETT